MSHFICGFVSIWFFLLPTISSAAPVQFWSPIPRRPTAEIPAAVTAEIVRDWATSAAPGAPDHSLRTVWVRMFPISTAPLGDQYPVTVDINNITLECSGGMNIYNLENQTLLGNTKALHLDFSSATFKIGNAAVALQKLWIVPLSATTRLRWDQGKVSSSGDKADVGVTLRGEFAVQQTLFDSNAAGKPRMIATTLWSVTNIVDVASYISSVVPSEIISTWEPETLKAQAIAARTYAMFEVAEARASNREWDIDPTTWFQSYRGTEFYDRVANKWRQIELSSTTAAVVATAGEVITYQGQVIKAYFSANSGGVTCTVSECFSQPDLPYIVQVRDAADVKSLPGGSWGSKATLTPKAIAQKLVALGLTPASPVARLEALRRGPSGRTWQLRVDLTSGSSIDLDELQTRQIMHLYGPIRSFLYTLGAISDGKQEISGNGFGHGVGLSQWGAQSFAKQGWSAHKILLLYYSGTAIQKL